MMQHPAAEQQQQQQEEDEDEGVNAIGETLYALVEKLNAPLAGKITGMLLDGMEQEDLMVLLDSPEDLKDTVGQAVEALREAGQVE